MVTLVLSEMRELARWGYYVTAALCVLFSKIWLPMAWGQYGSEGAATYAQFPEQLYFMNFGAYMTAQTFMLQAAVCVVALLVLACWLYEIRIAQFAARLRPAKCDSEPVGNTRPALQPSAGADAKPAGGAPPGTG